MNFQLFQGDFSAVKITDEEMHVKHKSLSATIVYPRHLPVALAQNVEQLLYALPKHIAESVSRIKVSRDGRMIVETTESDFFEDLMEQNAEGPNSALPVSFMIDDVVPKLIDPHQYQWTPLGFGKYKDKNLWQIYNEELGYIYWLFCESIIDGSRSRKLYRDFKNLCRLPSVKASLSDYDQKERAHFALSEKKIQKGLGVSLKKQRTTNVGLQYWLTRKGQRIRIKDMTSSHLLNTINFVKAQSLATREIDDKLDIPHEPHDLAFSALETEARARGLLKTTP